MRPGRTVPARRGLVVLALALVLAAATAWLACSSGGGGSKAKRGERTILMSEGDGSGGAEARPAKRDPRRQVLITRHDDARLGREGARQIAREMGVVQDPELVAYVQGIGKKLLRGVPRRGFTYEFQIVDQWEPNAFALPGGYIFISRGLLVLANNEDELACVIGHEITHAAKRHAAAQQALLRAQSRLAMPFMRAKQLSAYGRDMEREADEGGQILAAAAGYDPRGMSTFLASLGQMERMRTGAARVPTWFDTHPTSIERAAANSVRATQLRWKRDPELGDTRVSLLKKIEGLALEQRPQGGVFEGTTFVHPDLGFAMRFPPGWETSNSGAAVGARSPRGDAVVFLTADVPNGEPREVAEKFVAKTREEVRSVEVVRSQPVKIGHIDAWRMRMDVKPGGPTLAAWMTFVPWAGNVWRMAGITRSASGDRYAGTFLSTMRSFRPLSPEERTSIRYAQVHVVSAYSEEDLSALGQRTGNLWDPSRTAVFNGIFSNRRFDGGELVKIARVGTYVPPSN